MLNYRFAAIGAVLLSCPAVCTAAPSLTLLQSFDYQVGIAPQSPPVLGSKDVLFGTVAFYGGGGDGALYSIDRSGKNFTILYAFSGPEGSAPYASPLPGTGGMLYGTTTQGGNSGQGTVFSYDTASGTLKVLHAFNLADGAQPQGGLVADANGTLYGTTYSGGTDGQGTVFKFDPASKAFATLANFRGTNGAAPAATLTIGKNGDLFGTTASGGSSNNGTIFRVAAATGKLTVLHSFTGADGSGPFSGVTADKRGVLYGDTLAGGSNSRGVVYRLDPGSRDYTVLHDFAGGSDGDYGSSTLVADRTGALLGTTFAGGSNDWGVVFKIVPKTGAYSVLTSFQGSNGGANNAGMSAGGGNTFYGASAGGGGQGFGAAYKFTE